MALKKFKPTTARQRFKLISAFDEVTTGEEIAVNYIPNYQE